MLHGQKPVLHISSPRNTSELASHADKNSIHYKLKRTLQLRLAVLKQHGEQQLPVNKPSRDWRKARCQELLPMVGGILGSLWTAIARLKMGSPKTERCCPATVCYPHWVHGDYEQTEKQPASSAPGNKRENEKRPALKREKRPALKLGIWNVRTI